MGTERVSSGGLRFHIKGASGFFILLLGQEKGESLLDFEGNKERIKGIRRVVKIFKSGFLSSSSGMVCGTGSEGEEIERR